MKYAVYQGTNTVLVPSESSVEKKEIDISAESNYTLSLPEALATSSAFLAESISTGNPETIHVAGWINGNATPLFDWTPSGVASLAPDQMKQFSVDLTNEVVVTLAGEMTMSSASNQPDDSALPFGIDPR